MVTIGKIKIGSFLARFTQRVDWGLSLTNVSDSWKRTKGRGVRVAVLDTGVDVYHRDLEKNVKGGINITSSNKTDYEDRNGHGTHCAGIIGALNNKVGVVGVAPECELYVVKILGDSGSGNLRWLAEGIDWCVFNQMDIVSMSLGSENSIPLLERAVKNAYKCGVTLVAAAGNDYNRKVEDDVDYPARYSEVIAVAAIDPYKKHASFSSAGSQVEVSAPGVNILSTYPPNRYATLSGTSMATPFVTGVITLMKSKSPSLTIDDVRQKIKETAIDLDKVGKDKRTGYGLINPPQLATTKGLDFFIA